MEPYGYLIVKSCKISAAVHILPTTALSSLLSLLPNSCAHLAYPNTQSSVITSPIIDLFLDTGLPVDVLKYIGGRSVLVPEDFNLHHQLQKTHVEARLKKLQAGTTIDWGLAEALAMGSLLYQGFKFLLLKSIFS